MKTSKFPSTLILGVILGTLVILSSCKRHNTETTPSNEVKAVSMRTLLNVSYDPTREFYAAYNQWFVEDWKNKTGEHIEIQQSHGGAGKQARAVIEGLKADVVTLALAYDIDAIAVHTGKIPPNWQSRLPNQSSPYTSTIVFLVRKGNPKGIHDWCDLIKPDVEVITPNPKTSGGARWNYLAAWAWALDHFAGDELKTKDYMKTLFMHVPVLDTGARGATTTFVQREIGDVLLAWENEAFLAINELGEGLFEIVVPSISILAEPPVTVVDGNCKAAGNLEAATAYLTGLYEPFAQRLAAENYYRPCKPEYANPEDLKRFPDVKLVTIDDTFGGWAKPQQTHFSDGGTFDALYEKK
jgi:sulfate transport system substrate-binding protein